MPESGGPKRAILVADLAPGAGFSFARRRFPTFF
jgi:hypothetical protein